jgi:hypothetical protein
MKRAAQHLVEVKRYPQRRVCRLIGHPRSSSRYESRKDSVEEYNLVERLKQFVRNPRKRRRGYRLAHKDIAREWMIDGKPLNHKRVYRLWPREGLSVALRRVRKRIRTGNSVNTGRKIPKTPIENSPVLQSILILAAQQSGVLRP